MTRFRAWTSSNCRSNPWLLVPAALLVLACATGTHAENAATLADARGGKTGSGLPQLTTAAGEYLIQPLDLLQVNVFQEADLSVRTRVTQSGAINYPLLGTVQLAGLTLPEAQKKLTELLGADYLVHPQVNITIERSNSRRVVVLGQVKSPGTFEIPTDESLTLLQAIARAGGFSDIAAIDRISIIRSENGKEQKIMVNVSAIIKSGDRSRDIELRPGDVVSVPETIF